MDSNWTTLFAGVGCPMDAPREATNDHWDAVAPLSASTLYLAKNQTYRGHCQLIFDRWHVARPDQLTRDEWGAFTSDLYAAQVAVMAATHADHINLELLGNVVPHLHWHIVPRYFSDPRWGMPIWTTPLSAMPDTRLEAADRERLLAAIRTALSR